MPRAKPAMHPLMLTLSTDDHGALMQMHRLTHQLADAPAATPEQVAVAALLLGLGVMRTEVLTRLAEQRDDERLGLA